MSSFIIFFVALSFSSENAFVDKPEATAADSQAEEALGHFSEGDRVQANLEADIFEALQEGHGGWVASMAKVLSAIFTTILANNL